ncbi:hypothetical protein N7523_004366 [Penicillium sp. IBT 18751x]|nr:hypothetical protein N7523_004366 [Penicillium sp. IBT 18751x]
MAILYESFAALFCMPMYSTWQENHNSKKESAVRARKHELNKVSSHGRLPGSIQQVGLKELFSD